MEYKERKFNLKKYLIFNILAILFVVIPVIALFLLFFIFTKLDLILPYITFIITLVFITTLTVLPIDIYLNSKKIIIVDDTNFEYRTVFKKTKVSKEEIESYYIWESPFSKAVKASFNTKSILHIVTNSKTYSFNISFMSQDEIEESLIKLIKNN